MIRCRERRFDALRTFSCAARLGANGDGAHDLSWYKRDGKWKAAIKHNGKQQYLGRFDDEHEAARAVATAARRLRGEDAHGGRAGNKLWHRLNFPSKREARRAKSLGMPATH
jgi:hypothetical protein